MVQACNLPNSSSTDTPEDEALAAAELTLTAIALEASPTEALPTFTSLPSLTPTLESTSTPAFTSTPTFAYVTLSEATNCRDGSDTSFPIVDTFVPGQTIEVVGKHPFDNYWYVRSPKNASVYCWMWGFYATGGNLNNVPVVTPPPTYTPAPQASFTAEYMNHGKCISWWTRIRLTNTGPVAFKSIAITIKDTVTNQTNNLTLDGFQDVNACILSSITAQLGSGEAYTVVAPSLSADASGHLVSATIQLCSQTGLAGTCKTEVIEFTP